MTHTCIQPAGRHKEKGAAAVEFAVVTMAFLVLLFGIMEFGRLMYLFNTIQEVTRRAARQAAVTWATTHQTTAFKQSALFGGDTLPAGREVGTANVQIQYLNLAGNVVTTLPTGAADNLVHCANATTQCIASIQVSISGVTYAPMSGLFPFLAITLPPSTVTMPAESLGY